MDNATALRRHGPMLATVGGVVLLIVLVFVAVTNTRLGRVLRGVAVVELVNGSGVDIHGVHLATITADNSRRQFSVERLRPGERVPFTVQTSDLLFEFLVFQFNDNLVEHPGTELASKGDVLIIEIGPGGEVKVHTIR